MSIYGGKELGRQFRTVRQNTIQIAEDIPEEQYIHVLALPECRTGGQMLAEIAVTPRREEIHGKQRVMTLVGSDFSGLAERARSEETKPRTKAEIHGVACAAAVSPSQRGWSRCRRRSWTR